MAGRDLGEGTRLAAATGAWVCFEDESGQALQPPVARTGGLCRAKTCIWVLRWCFSRS